MRILMSPRAGNLAGFLACAAMLAYALYAQYVLGLEPCPLCVFQRVAVILLGLFFLAAGVHGPGAAGRRVYGALQLAAAAGGVAVAARHLWLQQLPPDQVPACGPGLDFMLDTFGIGEVIRMVLSGSGECAQVSWSLFGLSMPAWVLAALLPLGIYGLWINWRRDPLATARGQASVPG